MITAIVFVPESLPVEQRHGGGLRKFASGLSEVLRIRLFVGYIAGIAGALFSYLVLARRRAGRIIAAAYRGSSNLSGVPACSCRSG